MQHINKSICYKNVDLSIEIQDSDIYFDHGGILA